MPPHCHYPAHAHCDKGRIPARSRIRLPYPSEIRAISQPYPVDRPLVTLADKAPRYCRVKRQPLLWRCQRDPRHTLLLQVVSGLPGRGGGPVWR